MPELTLEPAPAPLVEPNADTLDLSKFFGTVEDGTVTGPPGTKLDPPRSAPVAPPVVATPAPVVVEPEKPATPPVESEIAAALREMREEREARTKVKEEASSWKGKYETLQAEYEAHKTAPAFEDDPVAYARSRRWTPEQQSEIVQMLAYDLAPERAPQQFMMKIMEARQTAKERQAAEERRAQQTEQARAYEVQVHQQYVSQLDAAASTFTPGAFPANEDWYGDNRRAYVSDLYHIANELAEEAQSKGQQANLQAEALAAQLEHRNAERLAALESRRGKRKPAAPAAPAVTVQPSGTKQSTGSPASTHGLREGAPRAPALTDEERVKRATEVAFSTR